MPPVDVIINTAGGSFVKGESEDLLRRQFAEAAVPANIIFAGSGEELKNAIDAAAKGPSEVIVGGGGDGTIALSAEAAYRSGKSLGVLPLGTLNHFSKDLRIPEDIASAIDVIKAGHSTAIDVGELNGRLFINNSSIGLYPRIVRHRERQQVRLGRGKWSAAFIAALRVFRKHPYFRLKFEIDGHQFIRKTPFVFVGNNEYNMDLYNIGSRDRMDAGKLSVYFLHKGGRWGMIELLLRTLVGRLRQWQDFETIETGEITIDSHKKLLMVALDGEVETVNTPLVYKAIPGALRVIVPEGNN